MTSFGQLKLVRLSSAIDDDIAPLIHEQKSSLPDFPQANDSA